MKGQKLLFATILTGCAAAALVTTSCTSSKLSYPIVATGQVDCYSLEGKIIDAPAEGDQLYGQDGNYQAGVEMAYKDNGDGTVSDLNTGLMWEKTPSAGPVTWGQAQTYCQELTLGGYDDWRLPTLKELFSISDFSTGWPYINTLFFNMTSDGRVEKDEQYWAEEKYTGVTTEGRDNAAFGVNHATGHIKAYPAGSDSRSGATGTRGQRGEGAEGEAGEGMMQRGQRGEGAEGEGMMRQRPEGAEGEGMMRQRPEGAEGEAGEGMMRQRPAMAEGAEGQTGDAAAAGNRVQRPAMAEGQTGQTGEGMQQRGQRGQMGEGQTGEGMQRGQRGQMAEGQTGQGGERSATADASSTASGEQQPQRGLRGQQQTTGNQQAEGQTRQRQMASGGGQMMSNPMQKRVRAVRGDVYGVNEFKDNGNGTVSDKATGLMWAKEDNGKGVDWVEAIQYAESSTFAGYDDWRLPNVKELQSIVDYRFAPVSGDARPAINPTYFNCTPFTNEAGDDDYGYYWTSTSARFRSGSPYYFAWYVAFGRAVNGAGKDVHGAGAVRFDSKADNGTEVEGGEERYYNFVRLVRKEK